jgi:small-conductance mechanosensitive channel
MLNWLEQPLLLLISAGGWMSVLAEMIKQQSAINGIEILPRSVNILGTEVPLLNIIITIVVIAAGFGLAKFLRIFITRYIGTKLPPDTRNNISKIGYYGAIAITLLSALGSSGVDLSGVLVAGGIAGIVIGFATQSLLSNMISGIFLQIDKPMKTGDPVLITGRLPDVAGIVIETKPLSTRIRMFDGTYVSLPNTEVFSSEIRNFSGAAARRVDFTVGVAYHEDIERAIAVIRRTLADTPLVLVKPEPDIYVDSLGDSSVNINVWCWVPFSEWFTMKMQLVQQVKKELDSDGIEIPFPQRVIHFANKDGKADDTSMDTKSLDLATSANARNKQ